MRLRLICDQLRSGRFASAAFLSVLLMASSGCGLLEPEIADEGTIEFIDIEGGCWIIQTEDEQYNPTNLPSEFREDGLAIQFEAGKRLQGSSFCPGAIIELSWIDYLETG